MSLMNFPKDEYVRGAEALRPLPYVVVGDGAFPLQKHLMRPYPGRSGPDPQKVFNYRLSRAKRTVENAFGILAARLRVFHTKLAVKPEAANDIVKAACIMHNFLQTKATTAQIKQLLEDNAGDEVEGLRDITAMGNHACASAIDIRQRFTDLFVNFAPVP